MVAVIKQTILGNTFIKMPPEASFELLFSAKFHYCTGKD